MKNWKILSCLLGVVSLYQLQQPSFAKQTWLKCGIKTINGETTKSNHFTIINLDDIKERFEITAGSNQIIQGKATFFKSSIKLDYLYGISSRQMNKIWEIDRVSLNYFAKLQMVGGLSGPVLSTGSCKVIPAPSSKKNLI